MSIVSELILRTGGFHAGVKSAQDSLHSLGGSASHLKGLLLSAFAAITTGTIGEGLKHAFDVGKELNELKAQTGASVSDLAILQQAFKAAGMEAEDVGMIMGRMNKALLKAAESGKSDALDRLGLSFEKLKKLGSLERFQAIGAAINKLHDPTVKAGTAMELFGRGGAKMLDLFSESGAMSTAAEKVGSQAELLEKNAEIFDQVSINLGTAGIKLRGFFVGMASTLAPSIAPLLDRLSKLDFAPWGQKIGKIFGDFIALIQGGGLGDALAYVFNQGIAVGSAAGTSVLQRFLANVLKYLQDNFGDALASGLTDLANLILQGLSGVAHYVMDALGSAAFFFVESLAVVTKAEFWAGLGNSLLAAAKLFVAMMLDGVAAILGALKNVPGIGGKAGAASDAVAKSAQGWKDSAASDASSAVGNVTQILSDLKEMMKAANIENSFQEGVKKAPQIDLDFGLEAAFKRGQALIAENDAAAKKLNAEPVKAKSGEPDDLIKAEKLKLGPVASQTLTKIGGGGVSVGGSASSYELLEARKHTTLLQTIAKNTIPKPVTGNPAVDSGGFSLFQ